MKKEGDIYIPGDPSTKNIVLRASSGTTGTPKLTIRRKAPFQKGEKRGALLHAYNSNSRAILNNQRADENVDIKRILNLRPSDIAHESLARILSEFKPTVLHLPYSAFMTLIESLGVDASPKILATVKEISLSGEIVPQKRFKELVQKFNTATFYLTFGASEVGQIGKSCPYISDFHYDTNRDHTPIHPHQHHIINVDNKDADGIGELVVITPTKEVRTGDMVKKISENCPCGAQETILVYGRYGFDIIHCVGATVSSSLIDDLFTPLKEYVNDYLIEVSEIQQDGKTMGQITVTIVPTPKLKQTNLTTFVESNIFEKFYMTNTKTLSELVSEHVFLQPKIVVASEIHRAGKKIHLKKA